MGKRNTSNRHELSNSKICDRDISPESLLNTYTCNKCEIPRKVQEFHAIEQKIGEQHIKTDYLIYLPCKTCIDESYFYWSRKQNKIHIDIMKLRVDYLNKIKQEYELQHNIILLTRAESMKFLNIVHRSHFNTYIKRELIKEIKLDIPKNILYYFKGCFTYQCYFIKSELEMIKYHIENGHYYLRATKSINDKHSKKIMVSNYPYFFINSKGKQIFFVNMTEKKKPCGVCAEIKDFGDFYENKHMQCGHTSVCKNCHGKKHKDYYDNLSHRQKQELLQRVREYSKIYNKTNPENRIIKNIRRRAQDSVRTIIDYGVRDEVEYSILKDIHCTRKELKTHIESQFKDNMNWDNYGIGYMVDNRNRPIYDKEGNTIPLMQWHVDHILPISKFNLEDPEAIKHINHYKNLRPEWSNENLLKSNKIIGELINNPEIKEIYDKYIQLCHKPKNVISAS